MCRGTLQWRGEWISDFPASSGGDEFPAPLRDPNNLGRLQLGRGKWPTRKEPIANLESYQIWLKSTRTWKETQTDRSNRRSLAEFLMGTSRFINEVAQHEEANQAVEANQEEKKELQPTNQELQPRATSPHTQQQTVQSCLPILKLNAPHVALLFKAKGIDMIST